MQVLKMHFKKTIIQSVKSYSIYLFQFLTVCCFRFDIWKLLWFSFNVFLQRVNCWWDLNFRATVQKGSEGNYLVVQVGEQR